MTTRPLEGVRILSFGQFIAGSDSAAIFGDLGADVYTIDSRIHVERAGTAAYSAKRSVKSISLEVTLPEGRDLFLRLVEHADVVHENFPAGVLDRWGLGYDVLAATNPRIILVRMSGFGQTGPLRNYVTYGGNLSSFMGLTKLWGVTHHAHNDYFSAIHAVHAVVMALEDREITGRGTHIDLAQVEVAMAALGPFYMEAALNGSAVVPERNRIPGSAYSGVFRSRQPDTWLAVELEDERDWAIFWPVVGRPDVAADPRFAAPEARASRWDELDAIVESWTRTLEARAAMHRLQRHGIAAAVVQNSGDAYFDPQLRARGAIVEVPQPDGSVAELPRSAFRLDKTPGIAGPSTSVGAANDEVYRGWLGIGDAELQALAAHKVI